MTAEDRPAQEPEVLDLEDRTRILIVDDHPALCAGLRALLEAEADLEVVGEAGSLAAAIAAVGRLHPDLVLLDLGLPDVWGPQAVRGLTEAHPDIRVLVLSGSGTGESVRDSLVYGAVGYLLKTSRSLLLADGVRRAALGRVVVDSELVSGLARASSANLTPRELEVLQAVSEGLTNRQTATLLGTSESTVKTHVARAMGKLKAADRTHAVALLMRRGLLT